MEFIGGFLVAIFIYVYGSYCGYTVIAMLSGNGKSSLDLGLFTGPNIRNL
jgi:hypothetical protein